MRVIIVTGVSGAGKTKAIRCLEDMGYYCVDNMPAFLVGKFVEMCDNSQGKLARVALVVDVRGQDMFLSLKDEIKELDEKGYSYEILFLEASDEAIVKRYKESRRRHPLSEGTTMKAAITREREMLSEVKKIADYIIDTTNMKPEHLKDNIKSLFSEDTDRDNMIINIVSFGFKYGLPMDCDLVFDVRFLRNPFYVEKLREKTGLDKEIRDYVMQSDEYAKFTTKLTDFVEYLIPQYIEEGKGNLVIGVGCTGGKHRSVVIAEHLRRALEGNNNCVINHRDIDRK